MAEDGGEVQVRLSQEGGDAVIAKLQELVDALEKAGEAAKETSGNTEKMGSSLETIASATVWGAIAGGVTAVMELGAAFSETIGKVIDFAKQSIEAASAAEQWAIQLEVLNDRAMGFDAAMEQATRTLDGLRGMSSNVSSTGDLERTFQRLTLLIGGTDRSLMDLTQRMTLFAEASGVSADQLMRVIQMAERTGTLPMRGQMAVASMQLEKAGISGADIKRAADEGGDALQKLTDKIQLTSEQTSFLQNSWANLEGGFGRASEGILELIGEALEPLKVALYDITKWLSSDDTKAAIRSFTSYFHDELQKTIGDVKAIIENMDYLGRSWALTKNFMFNTGPGSVSFGQWLTQKEQLKADHASRMGGIEDFGDVTGGSSSAAEGDVGSTHTPYKPEGRANIDSMTEALQKLWDKADEQHTLSGLTGIDEKIAQTNIRLKDENAQLEKAFNTAAQAGAYGAAGGPDWIEARNITDTKEAENRATAAANIQKIQDAANLKLLEAQRKQQDEELKLEEQYQNELARLNDTGGQTILDQIGQKYDRQIDALRKGEQKVEDQLNAARARQEEIMAAKTATLLPLEALGLLPPGTVDAITQEQQQKISAYDDRIRALQTALGRDIMSIEEKKNLDIDTERQKELGNWGAYYDDLQRKAYASGENMFVAAQANIKKVAADSYAAAQTVADGWNAAGLKIFATMTSMGQDVAVAVDSIWTNLSNSFSTGFLDIMEGKVSSLKDVLKSLWDSILKDFADMMAKMLERWLITGEAMGNGTGNGGILGGLFGGSAGTSGGGFGSIAQTVFNPRTGTYTTSVPGTYGGGAYNDTGVIAGQGFASPGQTNMSYETAGNTSFEGGAGGAAAGGASWGAIAGGAALGAGLFSTTGGSGATAAMGSIGGAALGGGLTAIGGALLSGVAVPVVGWIAAAVGAILIAAAAIFKPNTEAHVYGNKGNLAPIGSSISGSVIDMFDTTGAPGRNEFGLSVQNYVRNYLNSTKFDVHAGSAEDVAADWKTLTSSVIPTEMLKMLMGMQKTGGAGVAGIEGASTYGFAGWDKDAPLAKMLTGLGFSVDTITQIANTIDNYSADPQKFLDYLNALVGVVVGLHTATGNLGMSAAQIEADVRGQANQSAVEGFAKSGAELTAQAKELANYTGADQVAKAQELLKLVNQRWADEEAEVKKEIDLADQLHTSIQATIKQLSDALTTALQVIGGANPTDVAVKGNLSQLFGGGGSYASTQAPGPGVGSGVFGLWGKIQDASLDELPALAQEAQQLITSTFQLLIQQLQQIAGLEKQNATLQQEFGSGFAAIYAAAAKLNAPVNDFTSGLESLGQMSSLYTDALAQAQAGNTQAELDDITQIQNAAAARYQFEIQEIGRIQQYIENIGQSVAQQEFGFQYDVAGKTGGNKAQAQLLLDRIREQLGQIGSTTNVTDLNALTSQIQQEAGQYWGLSDKSEATMLLLNQLLDQMRSDATAQAHRLEIALQADNTSIQALLRNTGTLLATAEEKDTTALNDLTTTLKALDALVKDKLHVSLQAIVDTNGPLNAALQADIPLFTHAGDALDAIGNPTTGSATHLHGKFQELSLALDDTIPKIRQLGGGGGNGGSGGTTPPPAGTPSTTPVKRTGDSVLTVIQNNPSSVQVRVGM